METVKITPKALAKALREWYAYAGLSASGPNPGALFEGYGNLTWYRAAYSAATGKEVNYKED